MKPWIQQSLQEFNMLVQQDRMPHALIIYGNKHIGKLELAQHIVTEITGVDVGGDNLVVDDTTTNILIRNSQYKGLVYCQKELAKSSKTKQTSKVISVHQVRKMCDFLEKTSENIQIGIIDAGDDMHMSASNALLKTLEEPRNNTLIIILAHQLSRIPITVLSRCQKLHLSADKESFDWVQQQVTDTITTEQIQKLFKENNNTPSVIVQKLTSGVVQQETLWKKQLLSMAINPNNVNKIENTKDNELSIMQCLEHMLITCIELKTSKAEVTNATVKHILQHTQTRMLFELLNDVLRAKSLASTNVNISLLLDNLLIVWSHITHLQQYPKIFEK
jgi:DNA polymerase-3 subunit delta'